MNSCPLLSTTGLSVAACVMYYFVYTLLAQLLAFCGRSIFTIMSAIIVPSTNTDGTYAVHIVLLPRPIVCFPTNELRAVAFTAAVIES